MITELQELDNYLIKSKEYLARESGKRDKIKEQLEVQKDALQNIEYELDLLSKVNILFQKTSEFAREQAKSQIESLVTKCLQFIFESDIEFLIEIEEQRGKSNAEFYVINKIEDILVKTKPELSRGGGVVDIVSLALRIAFLQIHKPKIQGPLILDEPAKHVSDEFIFNVADFLKQTSELFNRQIIMVTHNHHLAAIGSNAYRVDIKGSESTVTRITS
ncbi:ATPase [Tissierella carlieri]|jgi:DNA repair exonuclease SbcCD ATPase subunit|uniref:ATPase n=1 Tax=Tissierella TaxID=41273 RepID=UPI002803F4E4|nr:ATPase [uncultured Tissierella sp.]MDU5079941.1 ATPase [Bacillota bacterium]